MSDIEKQGIAVSTKIRALGAALLAAPLFLGTASPALAATPSAGSYAESYGLLVDTTLLAGNVPLKLGPEVPIASSCLPGGSKSGQLIDVPADPLAHADVITDTATSSCAPTSGKATSNIVNVDALMGQPVAIHADAITTTSTTSCDKAPKGSFQVVNLSIAGTPFPIPAEPIAPNTVVLPQLFGPLGLTVILNEQHPAAEGRGLVVNGIHIIAAAEGAVLPVGGTVIRGDIIVAHAVSGVVCPGGPGSDNGGLPKPDISFSKNASPSTAGPGTTVTYTSTIKNQSTTPCEVLRFVDHIAPAFTLVSTDGGLGKKFDTPPPARSDGGVDAVLRPTGVTIGAGKSVTQTFTVKVKDDATPGTYYNTMEIFCGPNGDFVSGPLAPVTVPAPGVPVDNPGGPVEQPPTQPVFAPTGLSTTLAGTAVLLLMAGVGTRRLQLSRR